MLFADFSAKPILKSQAQISLKDEHYKLPPTSLQFQLVNYYENFAMIAMNYLHLIDYYGT